jgi:hypothetical protein
MFSPRPGIRHSQLHRTAPGGARYLSACESLYFLLKDTIGFEFKKGLPKNFMY